MRVPGGEEKLNISSYSERLVVWWCQETIILMAEYTMY